MRRWRQGGRGKEGGDFKKEKNEALNGSFPDNRRQNNLPGEARATCSLHRCGSELSVRPPRAEGQRDRHILESWCLDTRVVT